MNYEFSFKLSTMPPINSTLRWALSKVNCKWSGLTLQGVGDHDQLCDLHLGLAKAIGINNVELLSIKVRENGGEPELLPRAIGFTDLPTKEKQLLVSTAVTSTVAIKTIALFLGCSFEQAAAYVSEVSSVQFESLSPEQIESAVENLAKSLHEHPDESFFVLQA